MAMIPTITQPRVFGNSFPGAQTMPNPKQQYASLLGDADRFAARLPQTQMNVSAFPGFNRTLESYQQMFDNPGIQRMQPKPPEPKTQELTPQQAFASNYKSNIDTSSITGFAKSMLGKPYVWGSANPAKGVDCSGLTVNAARAAGLKIPRTASAQLQWFKKNGRATNNLKSAKPGDLLYFRSEASPSGYHTGVYMGNRMMIHAAGTGQGVIQSKLGNWYTSRLLGVGIT